MRYKRENDDVTGHQQRPRLSLPHPGESTHLHLASVSLPSTVKPGLVRKFVLLFCLSCLFVLQIYFSGKKQEEYIELDVKHISYVFQESFIKVCLFPIHSVLSLKLNLKPGASGSHL
jgi:hypothetical protein